MQLNCPVEWFNRLAREDLEAGLDEPHPGQVEPPFFCGDEDGEIFFDGELSIAISSTHSLSLIWVIDQ